MGSMQVKRVNSFSSSGSYSGKRGSEDGSKKFGSKATKQLLGGKKNSNLGYSVISGGTSIKRLSSKRSGVSGNEEQYNQSQSSYMSIRKISGDSYGMKSVQEIDENEEHYAVFYSSEEEEQKEEDNQ